jgi:putative two-component system response regulator
MGYTFAEARIINQAGLLHDIGKKSVPQEILNKPCALTPREYSIVKLHTTLGRDRINHALQILTAAAIIAEQHHERWNGTGYLGHVGEAIHPYANLVAVADVFDSLASKRPYKDAWPVDDIFAYFESQSGALFSPDITSALARQKDEISELYR